jgi:hypothetical protein
MRTLQRKSHLCAPRKGIAWPKQSKFPHSCVCEGFIYSQDRSTYFPAAEKADQLLEYMNRLLTVQLTISIWQTILYSKLLQFGYEDYLDFLEEFMRIVRRYEYICTNRTAHD